MTSADAHPFHKQIAERPYDVELRLVYADWLEERGMPTAAERVRAKCLYRMPRSKKERKELERRAVAYESKAVDLPKVVAHNLGAVPDLTLQGLSMERLSRNFPRDGTGSLSLGTSIVLDNLGPRGRRDQLLVAVGPQRRKDPQQIRMEQITGYCMNCDHDWSMRREWWTTAESVDDSLRWASYAPELAHHSALGSPSQRSALEEKASAGSLSELERQALIIHRLDAGAFEDALALAGVSCTEELSRMLDAEEFPLPVGSDWRFDTPKIAERRALALRQTLWESSPWTFGKAIEIHQQRANERRSHKKFEPLYLYIVPGQSTSKRARVSLVLKNDEPHLTLLASGSNVRPWRWTWSRPASFEAKRWRLGLADRDRS